MQTTKLILGVFAVNSVHVWSYFGSRFHHLNRRRTSRARNLRRRMF